MKKNMGFGIISKYPYMIREFNAVEFKADIQN